MKPLIVLLATFFVTLIITKFTKSKKINLYFAGRLSISALFVFTGLGHFFFPEGMSKMIPEFIPAKIFLVYFTGILEIFFAILLHFKKYTKIIGWLLIVFLILILPANINAAIHNLNYQTGELNGPGLEYLWFRIPLQLFFIAWIYVFTVRKVSKS